ncbi:MAG: hypothetical protein OXJ52_03840 [Oligoflexia bacterium]|nr:hypothetical protein [Oligoflexia bacterium]
MPQFSSFIVLPLFALAFHCYSSAGEFDFNPANKERLLQKSLSQAFWQRTRHSAPLFQISEWKNLQLKHQSFYDFLNQLIKDHTIIIDHFYNVFLERQGAGIPTEPETHFKANQKLEELFSALKKDKPEEIQKFMEEHSFTKADKILAVLHLIYYGSLNEKIFELMEALSLSVNDSLSFKEIKSSMLPEEFKNKEETVVVLSHHLLATKKPKIIERLMEREIDFGLKLATGDNIIYSYILLNQNLKKKERKRHTKGLIAFLQIPQAKSLLKDKNSLGLTPLHFTFSQPDKKLRRILIKKFRELSLLPSHVMAQDYSNLWNYIAQEKPKASHSPVITYLNFQAFLKNLFNFFDPYQTKESRSVLMSFFNDFHANLMKAEKTRLLMLHEFSSKEGGIPKNTRLILQAIFNRDENFFKTLDSKEGLKTEEIFLNFTYVNFDKVYLLSNPLLEAIRQSFTPAVEYILKKLRQSETAQKIQEHNKIIQSYSLDPLSLAFVTYGSLDLEDPFKPPAKKILRLIYDNLPKLESYYFPLSLSPIEWALFFGLKEEVRFLHESKKMGLPPTLTLEIDGHKWLLDWETYLTEQNFKHLASYLSSQKQSAEPQEESLEGTVDRIFRESSKKAQEVFLKMSKEEQIEQALGPELWEKYRKGQLRLEDFKDQNEDQEEACKKQFIH